MQTFEEYLQEQEMIKQDNGVISSEQELSDTESNLSENFNMNGITPFEEWLSGNDRHDMGMTQFPLTEDNSIDDEFAKTLIEQTSIERMSATFMQDKNNLDENAFTGAKAGFVSGGIIGATGGGVAGVISGAIGGGIAGLIVGALTTTLWRNRREIGLRWGSALHVTTRRYVMGLYYDALQSLIKKRKLPMEVYKKGATVIVVKSKIRLPNVKDFPEVHIDVSDNYVSVLPVNTGGSMSLSKIDYNDDLAMQVTSGKAKDFTFFDDDNELSYLGKGYKIPKGGLNYQKHMVVIWYVIVDIISEIYSDFSIYFRDVVKSIQSSKKLDGMIFSKAINKLDLEKDIVTYISKKTKNDKE